ALEARGVDVCARKIRGKRVDHGRASRGGLDGVQPVEHTGADGGTWRGARAARVAKARGRSVGALDVEHRREIPRGERAYNRKVVMRLGDAIGCGVEEVVRPADNASGVCARPVGGK